MFTNTKESGLEALIVKWLVDHNGYEEGTNADYNNGYHLFWWGMLNEYVKNEKVNYLNG